MDSTDLKALRSQKLDEMDAAVVAIGDNFEATVLTTLNLLDMGIPRVIVRASGRHQERILRSLGVQEISRPRGRIRQHRCRAAHESQPARVLGIARRL